jgi:hypothetical protein
MQAPKIDGLVSTHLPDRFLISAMKVAFLARRQTHEHCAAEFADEEYHNVAPYYLRAKAEGLIRNTAALFPQFSAEVLNCSGWRHTEITSGPIRFTVHAVESPCAVVDKAQYRQSLAESQTSFFDPTVYVPDAKLYALLLHGPYVGRDWKDERQYRYLPGSMYLAFPEFALKGYAHKINLFDRYPKALDSLLPKEWDSKAHMLYKFQARQRVG